MSASAGSMIRLVAGREISTRLRSKVFVLTTGFFVLAIVLGAVLYTVFASDDADPVPVGVTEQAAEFGELLDGLPAADGEPFEVVRIERAEGEEQVREGDLDLLVDGSPGSLQIIVESDLGFGLEASLRSVAEQQLLAQEIVELGGDPEEVAQAVAASAPEVVRLEAEPERSPAQIVAGFAAGILLFISILGGGQRVAQGVVEEKSSRVVELLLATMRPWQLMAGKVIGNIIVGLIEIGVIVLTAAITVWGFGIVEADQLDLGFTTLWVLAWFLVGFTMFAVVLAGLAALVSRQEEVGSVTSPIITLMMIPYIVGVSIAPWDPDNTIVQVMSYLPFCAPFIMPIRAALGAVGNVEVIVALAVSIALIPLLCWIAARLYNHAILRTGARVSLLTAFRRS